jgi:hypothetical protein
MQKHLSCCINFTTLKLALFLLATFIYSAKTFSNDECFKIYPGFSNFQSSHPEAKTNNPLNKKNNFQTSGNIMLLKDLSGITGDDILVELEILNEDEFVGFQLDIPLPDGFDFMTGSGMLNPERITNHELAADLYPGTSLLRIMSYSLTNDAFTGNSGTIATFILHTPGVPGNYGLEILHGIIGNINAENIITGTINGNITLTEPIPVHNVNFIIQDTDQTVIEDAVVTLGEITNPAGNYGFTSVPTGLYDYTIEHATYNLVNEELEVYADLTVTVTLARKVYTIQAVSANQDYGYVSGSGNYEHGQEVILTATAYNGSQFTNWTEQETSFVVSLEPVFQFIAESDGNFIASFTFTVPDTRTVQNIVITDGQEVCYDAVESIAVSNFTVHHGGTVILAAGTNIVFAPEISVDHGAHLHARISYDYCANPQALPASFEYSPQQTTELESRPASFFKVFPNPTTGCFTLRLAELNESNIIILEIFSMMGEKVIHTKIHTQQQYEFDLSNSPDGVYIIRIIHNAGMSVEKVIKK